MLKKSKKRIIFTLDPYKKLSTNLLTVRGYEKGICKVKRFSNGELYVQLKTSPVGRHVYIVGSFMPTDTHFMQLLLLSHTLKKEKAQDITLLIPYLPYSRQEKNEANMSMNTAWAAQLLQTAGIKRIVTIDMHSSELKKLYTIPLISLSPASLLVKEIKKLKLTNFCLVAPDEGALDRIMMIKKLVSKKVSVAYLKKERSTRIKHTELVGTVCENAIIIDDILDTGSTLVSCVQMLRAAGVQCIWVMVTHGLFTGNKWKTLLSNDIEMLYVTDSIPSTSVKGIQRISITSLYKDYLTKKKKNYNV